MLLDPDYLRLVQRLLAQHVPELDVWAFGSRVVGSPKPHSDLDLAFVSQQPIEVNRLARSKQALELGEVTGLIHSAGVSPSQAPIDTILKVDLHGTAVVLEEFGNVIAAGGSGVVADKTTKPSRPFYRSNEFGIVHKWRIMQFSPFTRPPGDGSFALGSPDRRVL